MLIEAADRDVLDARVEGISDDRSFACAYYGAIGLATVALRASGYRTRGAGHHQATIEALPELMGPQIEPLALYLDRCRTKRNKIDYDGIGYASERDVEDLIAELDAFRAAVLDWLAREHPELV